MLYILVFMFTNTAALYASNFDVTAMASRSIIVTMLKVKHPTAMKWLYITQTVITFLSLCAYVSKFVAAGTKLHFMLEQTTDLKGQTAVITGGTSGIGRETALQLLRWRGKVVIIGRDKTKGANAIEYLRKAADVGFSMIQYIQMDLNDLKSIKSAAEEILSTNKSIDFLINNAGTADRVYLNAYKREAMFATNFLGHFYLTKLLTPALTRDCARVIDVASIAHYYYDPKEDPVFKNGKTMQLPESASHYVYYARSKLFNIWHSQVLQRRFDALPPAERGAASFSCAPGIVDTPLLHSYTGGSLSPLLATLLRCFTKAPADGANTILYLCSAPIEELVPGGYYSECKLGYVSKHVHDREKQEALFTIANKMING